MKTKKVLVRISNSYFDEDGDECGGFYITNEIELINAPECISGTWIPIMQYLYASIDSTVKNALLYVPLTKAKCMDVTIEAEGNPGIANIISKHYEDFPLGIPVYVEG